MTKLRATRDETMDRLRDYAATTDPDMKSAIETLILAENNAFVHFVARQYQRGVDLDDLVAVARSAMLTAIRRFDITKSEQFPMYASRCMRRDLLTEVRKMSGPVAKPRHSETWPQSVSMEFDHDGQSLHDTLQSDEDVETDVLRGTAAEELNAALSLLPDRDAKVVRLRFGLDGCQPHELAEIGVVLNVSKQRVHVILKRALAILRSSLTDTPEPRAA